MNKIKRRDKKKIVAIIIMFAIIGIILIINPFSKLAKKDYGDIKKVKTVSIEKNVTEEDAPFATKDNNTDYEYKLMKDYFAKYQMPYPDNWKVKTVSANHIEIKKPNSDTQIVIEHVADPFEGAKQELSSETVSSVSQLKEMFTSELAYQTLPYDGGSYTRSPDQNSTLALGNGLAVNEGHLTLVGEDYDKLWLKRKSEYAGCPLSERRYYVRYKGIYSCISITCPRKDFDKMKGVIDFMVSNISPVSETYNEVLNVTAFEKQLNVPVKFKKKGRIESQTMDTSGTLYSVASNSHSSMAGMFIETYEISKKIEKKTPSNFGPEDMFLYALDIDPSTMNFLNYTEKLDKQDPNYVAIKSKYKNCKVKGYRTEMVVEKLNMKGTRLLRDGDTWYIEEFVISSGNKSEVLVIGYPMARQTAAINIIKNL